MSSGDKNVELLQGTLDLIILRALSTMGPLHSYALATRLAQVSDHPLSLNQGTLYPALVRMEQKGWIKGAWGRTESNREDRKSTRLNSSHANISYAVFCLTKKDKLSET